MTCDTYYSLGREYDNLLGDAAEATWRSGILAELAWLRPRRDQVIIDLGAGTGIGGTLIRDAGWGHRRIGVDRSARMLRSARRNYESLVIADMALLPVAASSADFIVCGFDTMNYLPPAQLQSCLAGAGRCLKPGGWLIFDYSSPELLRRRWRDCRYDQQLPDGTLRWRNRYDTVAGRCVSELERYDARGHMAWQETHVQYALDTYSLHEAAMAAGLRTERVRDLERPEFSPSASTHVWVLRNEAAG
jgi:SAM-dependent methyltransferase